MTLEIQRIRAFTRQGEGGNPAGVVLLDGPATELLMQETARAAGYSETAFLHREGEIWRVRYFAPRQEVPFCGHATIGAGAVLGSRFGPGIFRLRLHSGDVITVEALLLDHGEWGAALQSPPTWSALADSADIQEVYSAFGIREDERDERFPVRIIHAGAKHLVIALRERQRLSHLGYHFETGAAIQRRLGLATLCFVVAETRTLFHARHPFAVGGVYEDPATGAGAAAFAGYLRDIGWLNSGRIHILQGEDMGVPCHLIADFEDIAGSSVRISGETAFHYQ
jgi:PhzF family phenazine biosynthesis protein